jgi:hypothetical protein
VKTTTVQLERATHGRLTELKHEMTFDELINLMLDLVTPEEIERAREARNRAYLKWQAEIAKNIRTSRAHKRLF